VLIVHRVNPGRITASDSGGSKPLVAAHCSIVDAVRSALAGPQIDVPDGALGAVSPIEREARVVADSDVRDREFHPND
jgi:hypothetical protein